jgi:transglycosylase-like protein with SLT domain
MSPERTHGSAAWRRARGWRARWWLAAGALACVLGAPAPARAAEIGLPLTIRFELLVQQLTRELYTEPGGIAPLWRESRCRYLSLDHPAFDRRGSFLRFVTHGEGTAGTRLLWFCLNALRWRGFVEALTAPYVTADWQLRLRVAESSLYDESWRKGLLSGLLWDVTERALLPRLTGLTVDLTPPRDDVLGLIRMVVAPSDAARMEAILRSATVRTVEVRDDAVVVHLALEVPEAFVRPRPPATPAEPPLGPAELEAVERALERWDAFLVFVVKSLGLDIADPGVRAELFGLLIESRYELLPILAGNVRRSEGDPVRRLFTEAWGHLHDIVARAERRGLLGDKALRYAGFISAGDALVALDRAAPGLGIEISADGLRRLARLLRPGSTEDPLLYGVDVDAALRSLFGLPPESDLAPAPVAPSGPGPGSGLPWRLVSLAVAAEGRDNPVALNERLTRWVPDETELGDYHAVMERLLALTADRTLRRADLEGQYARSYRTMIPATALQESCWRQFERKGDTITYRASALGSVGLMQVNQRVWRGFYNVERLKWDTAYNARAGAEILLRYLRQYGIEEGRRSGRVEDAVRSTYAVYNAGPRAVSRYRDQASTPRERRVDEGFWALYRGFAGGGTADLRTCATAPAARGERR